jgi:redox-sensing transcriptional repressor
MDNLSSLTLNRLSVYLRALRQLQEEGLRRISSQELAQRFLLSADQMRKDLAQVGELGIRGVGYDVATLRLKLEAVFGLERQHLAIIVGAGNVGSALARFPGFNSGHFQVVALLDNDSSRIGTVVGQLPIRPSKDLDEIVRATGAEIGILTVPAEAAQENYEKMVDAGLRAVLNFAPVQLREIRGVRTKNVDLMILLEELAFSLREPHDNG